MSLFRTRTSEVRASAHQQSNVQEVPLEVGGESGEMSRLKIDVALVVTEDLIVSGWSTGPIELELRTSGRRIEVSEVRLPREDVATHFSLPPGEIPGFVLTAQGMTAKQPITLAWRVNGNAWQEQTLTLDGTEELEKHPDVLGVIGSLVGRRLVPFSPEWNRYIRRLPVTAAAPSALAHGFIESALAFPDAEFVVVGWCVAEPGTPLWLEDDLGGIHSLHQASWHERVDVQAAMSARGFGVEALRSGFLLRGSAESKANRIRLKALTSHGVHVLAECEYPQMQTDPVVAARWLFGIPIKDGRWAKRYAEVNEPIIASLITQSQSRWRELPVALKSLGVSPEKPVVSIIVPLYGRYDFVESQMVEWVRDAWIRAHAELVYVLDDPALVESFRAHAEALHRLYGVPFRWVWGGANRGFSGANNLGAAHSTGEYLLFLNSDVFPQQPGWLERMLAHLQEQPDAGIVGARLTFAEGGIQHAGMQFEWMSEYGAWINQHPMMGLDPSLDIHRGAVDMPAVTGACMLIRRTDFEVAGGWDTGYLIGDFEDSDLCLKVRQAGKRIVYLPDVQLTHLERQSFKSLGSDDFRMQVTLWNAFRHQHRWREMIEASTGVVA